MHRTPDTGQCAINVEEVLPDPFDREALIEARPNFGAIEFRYSRYSRRGPRDIVDQKAGYAIVDDFRVEPERKAMTGVPQAMALIMTSPKGSGQSMGKMSAEASPRNLAFCLSFISPMNSTLGWESTSGLMTSSQ